MPITKGFQALVDEAMAQVDDLLPLDEPAR